VLLEVERLLSAAGLRVPDLDLIAVGLGPGSFTGLRIGLAAAKGLAWGARKPLIGVPTLETLARGMPPEDRPLCTVIDARKGQFYAARYAPDKRGGWLPQDDAAAWDPRTLAPQIDTETVFIGPGLQTWANELAARLGPRFVRGPLEADFPKAAHAARAALERLARGEADGDPARVLPLYIRPPDLREPDPRPVAGA